MKSVQISISFAVTLVLVCTSIAPTVCADEPTIQAGFIDLFDGHSLNGWDGDARFWGVEDGVIVGQTTLAKNPEKNTFLISRHGEFADFELRLSYQVEGYNSGVQYRSVDQGQWSVSGYQCDFEARWHTSKENPTAAPTDTFSGMFFDEGGRMFLGARGEAVVVRSNPENPKKPLIEKIGSLGDPVELELQIRRSGWNDLTVIAKGNQFIHIINGQVMAIGMDEDAAQQRAAGLFAFQLHKGQPMKIQLKDIRVRNLDASAPTLSKVWPNNGATLPPAERIKQHNAAYEHYALRHPGDSVNGKRLFEDKRTNCNVCHKVAGKGGDVGKDLSSIGGKFDRPHLIESLLEPSRQIVEGYRTTSIVTTDGLVFSGIAKSQTDTHITLVDALGKLHSHNRDNIEQQIMSSTSLMPEGLASQLSQDEFTDLIAYLETLGTQTDKRGGAVVGAISMPDGFAVNVLATGMDGLTALEVLPDGRILVCEQPGRVRVIENDKLMVEPFVTLPVESYWERGVIGVTYDPEFPVKPYIYVCWVAKEPYPHHRVSRFTMSGNVAVEDSELLLLVGDDQSKMGGKVPAGHQGGALHFGPDGKLYIAIGEQTSGTPAQSLDTFLGKILRINSDGTIPEDNPLISRTQGKYRAIWAYGCRNPFTFAFRKPDGLMLINDVGGNFEEINVGRAGANYGWPVVEHGDLPEYRSAEFDGPIHCYPQSSLNGGDFCPNSSQWPNAWRGKYFFADFQHGWINTIDPLQANEATNFLSGIRQPVDLRFAADGSLYVLLRNAWVIDDKFGAGTGSVLKIRPDHSTSVRAAPREQQKSIAHATSISSPTSVRLPVGELVLTEDAVDESAGGLPAFKIATPSAIYYLEKTGGGLSSLVDREGNDWLGFEPTKGSGAGGEFRGFPNAVHKQQGSYFHAKNAFNDPVKTRVEHADQQYVSILVQSESGHWAGRYEFFPTHCTFTVTQVPKDGKYWVLYEGTPGGELNSDDWWMTSAIDSPQPINRQHAADIPQPEWMAFGDAAGSRSIVMLNHEDDNFPDFYYPMNNQMTVFGFGREKLEAYHSKAGQRFSIALLENTSHAAISTFANAVLLSQTTERNDARDSHQDRPAKSLGPRPGDVYREYALHNGGNFDWRVTDPRATQAGAKMFLPNPVLKLEVLDLDGAIRAEALIDRWGGHVGTKDKRIRFNDNDWITLPELTTTPVGHEPERYHSQDNPIIPVPLDHLIQGVNTIEGTVGPGNQVGWGQWGLYSVILRVYYDPTQKSEFARGTITTPVAGEILNENPTISLDCDSTAERIDVLAWYDGYDEDGNGVYREWHESHFQPLRGQPADVRDHVGTIDPSTTARKLMWRTQWIPDQEPESIKLIARIHHSQGLIFVTDPIERLSLKREGWSVKQYRATEVPEAFGVRVGRSKSCNIRIDPAARLENAIEAVLHYRTWEAADAHHEPFQLNGHKHQNLGLNHHYDYDTLPILVSELTTGDNTFTIQSNTEHHMLEVLWPGPAITVRYRLAAPSAL